MGDTGLGFGVFRFLAVTDSGGSFSFEFEGLSEKHEGIKPHYNSRNVHTTHVPCII